MRRAPGVIKIKTRGRRYRTYVPALRAGEMQCAFCAGEMPVDDYAAHVTTCENHPFHLEPRSPRTGETPEQILNRLAARLNCEPRQVCDRVIRILEERQNVR